MYVDFSSINFPHLISINFYLQTALFNSLFRCRAGRKIKRNSKIESNFVTQIYEPAFQKTCLLQSINHVCTRTILYREHLPCVCVCVCVCVCSVALTSSHQLHLVPGEIRSSAVGCWFGGRLSNPGHTGPGHNYPSSDDTFCVPGEITYISARVSARELWYWTGRRWGGEGECLWDSVGALLTLDYWGCVSGVEHSLPLWWISGRHSAYNAF